MRRMRRTWPVGLLLVTALTDGCGGASKPFIASRWKYDAGAPAAAPGLGPEQRVLIALKSGTGGLFTRNEQDGTKVDAPIMPLFATEHAPVASGSTIVLVTLIGKLAGLLLSGQMLYTKPDAPLGKTSPVVVAPDGSLRIASTTGMVAGFAAGDGSTLFMSSVNGAIDTAPAVSPDGTTYVGTDTGHLTGVNASGMSVFDVTVPPPASGPSTASGKIAVGAQDGVHVFDTSQKSIFSHPRSARVVGTKILDSGEIIAWGEDGVFELLSPTGDVIGSFKASSPIYANAIPLKTGSFAIFDSQGGGHLVDRQGHEISSVSVGGMPENEIVLGDIGYVFVTAGNIVHAYDFTATE
jgi:outer membrane protein assembly factor BamB